MRFGTAPIAACCVVLSFATDARADPWFDGKDSALEDPFADGELDEDDHAIIHLGGHPGVTDVHGESWVSLAFFTREAASGRDDVGGVVVVGLALDRLATGPVHRVADPLADPPRAPEPSPKPSPDRVERVPVGFPAMARECVAAAWRASGLGTDDERIDSMVARSRSSALLPETRLRAMRLLTDAARTTTLATTDGTNYYDAVGANLVLELRLTWRLDRLLFAGDEPTLERLRQERQDARARLATRALEVLFAWQRAGAALREAVAGSPQEADAEWRRAEAAATLDVLTGGWFSARGAP